MELRGSARATTDREGHVPHIIIDDLTGPNTTTAEIQAGKSCDDKIAFIVIILQDLSYQAKFQTYLIITFVIVIKHVL